MDQKFNLNLSVKELTVNNGIKYNQDIKKIQNSLISFCMNANLFQKYKNMHELNLSQQFKFNECVDTIINKLQTDISQMELFYSNCRDSCIKINPIIEDNIEEYITKASWIFQPELHPCVGDCTDLFKKMYMRYVTYMTKDNGMYFEFIDYEKLI
jgi:hypothetical protein